MSTSLSRRNAFYGHFINGQWISDQHTIAVMNKYNKEEIARIGRASREIVSDAVTNALETFNTRKLDFDQRYEILMRAADIAKERKEELAMILVQEVGKVLKDARGKSIEEFKR